MSKRFILSADFIMSKTFEIEAENEEHAIEIFEHLMKENPYDFAYRFDAYVDHEVTEVEED